MTIEDTIKQAVEEAIQPLAQRIDRLEKGDSNLPVLLTKQELKEVLGIGNTKASELLNRPDFPVIREFGNPKVPRDQLLKWIDEHTEWVEENEIEFDPWDNVS
ncbi:hypothetical protein [Salibacterium qingdaonense]|uniref:Helix-turn-helix domain-containing protein n=1 Tax=Salibacterium qingdaonense TaxID=266892 RepID=A0A1I4QX03_9BACI|nr:hypothetical protein [Salibacterium qingdaonense]SFM44203.1 hypothetical protein SAMN04488054_15112 [Salibacterium qingdaonense]